MKDKIIIFFLGIVVVLAVVLAAKSIKEELESRPTWYKYTKTEEAREKTRECRRNGQNTVIIYKNGEYTIQCVQKKDD